MAAGKCALRTMCNHAVKESKQYDGTPGIGAVLHLVIVTTRRGRQPAAQPEP